MQHKRKISGWALFISFLLAGNLMSCAGHNNIESRIDMPSWIENPPESRESYSSVVSTRGADLSEKAKEKIAMAVAEEEARVFSSFMDARGLSVPPDLVFRIGKAVLPLLPQPVIQDSWTSPEGYAWIWVTLEKREWTEQKSLDKRMAVPSPRGLEDLSGRNVSFFQVLQEEKLPCQLIPGGEKTPYRLSLVWDEKAAEGEYGLKASLRVEKYGVSLAERVYGPVEGKNNEIREEGSSTILNQLRDDAAFFTLLKEILSL